MLQASRLKLVLTLFEARTQIHIPFTLIIPSFPFAQFSIETHRLTPAIVKRSLGRLRASCAYKEMDDDDIDVCGI